MLLDGYLSNFSMTSLKQYMEYFNFRCKIPLDHPVRILPGLNGSTGLPNKACPRLRDHATAPARGIMQPSTNLIREPCTLCAH